MKNSVWVFLYMHNVALGGLIRVIIRPFLESIEGEVEFFKDIASYREPLGKTL